MSPYGYISVESGASFWVVDTSEALIEEVVEALMQFISLTHDDCVTSGSRVTYCCYGVDLGRGREGEGGVIVTNTHHITIAIIIMLFHSSVQLHEHV